jgi:hypothetical protein
MKVRPDPIGPGQDSVWSYRRPAVAEPSHRHLNIVHRDVIIADIRKGIRTLEAAIRQATISRRPTSPPWLYDRPRIVLSASGKAKRSTSMSWFATKRCAMWLGAILIRTQPSDSCGITWRFTHGPSTAASSTTSA